MRKSLEFIKKYSVQEVVEMFLALVIGAVSIVYIAGAAAGYEYLVIPISLVFYSVLPVSMVLLGFLTYKVSMMLYHQQEHGKILGKSVMALLLAMVAINIGFIISISAGDTLLTGMMGMFKISFLIVILSLALSISVLSRYIEDIDAN
jgi:hypothetical protein